MGVILEDLDINKIGDKIINYAIETISYYKLNDEDTREIASRLHDFANNIERNKMLIITKEQRDRLYKYLSDEMEIDSTCVELNELLDILDNLKELTEKGEEI